MAQLEPHPAKLLCNPQNENEHTGERRRDGDLWASALKVRDFMVGIEGHLPFLRHVLQISRSVMIDIFVRSTRRHAFELRIQLFQAT